MRRAGVYTRFPRRGSMGSGNERRGRLRAARTDAAVGSIRAAIENLFGLPEGSVKLCGPDGSLLRTDATIATPRRRWE